MFHPLEPEAVDHVTEQPFIIVRRFQTALFSGIYMPEVDARRINRIHFTKTRNFFHRADLGDLTHCFRTKDQVLQAVKINVVSQNVQPFLGAGNYDFPPLFPLRGRMKNNPLPAHEFDCFCAVQNVAVRFCRHFVVGIAEIDIVWRMRRNFDARSLERSADGSCFFIRKMYAPSEGIFEAIQAARLYKRRGIFRMLVTCRIKTFRITARSEFDHILPPNS